MPPNRPRQGRNPHWTCAHSALLNIDTANAGRSLDINGVNNNIFYIIGVIVVIVVVLKLIGVY